MLKECSDKGRKHKEVEAHMEADGLLLTYINDPEITMAFNSIDKWYE